LAGGARFLHVPYKGGVPATVAGVSGESRGSRVFAMNGVYAPVEEGLAILRRIAPDTALSVAGEALVFPMDRSDKPLHDYLGGYPQVSLEEGVTAAYQAFRSLLDRGLVKVESIE
jgi:hypothetical protein